MNAVDVKQTGEDQVTLEWVSQGDNDMIADATLALLAGVDKSPASVKISGPRECAVTSPGLHAHAHADGRYERVAWFLEAHFGAVELHSEPGRDPVLIVRVDGEEARVDLMPSARGQVVNCENERLRGRVESVVEMAELTVRSLDEYVG